MTEREITIGSMMHVCGSFHEKIDYTVRLTVQMTDPVEPGLLRAALEKTQKRYPYFSVRLKRGRDAWYYEDNPLPVVLTQGDQKITLNAEETNYHVWAAGCCEDRIHLDIYHGITDGTGMYRVLGTLLYYYCEARYGLKDHSGILTLDDPIQPAETEDPQDFLSRTDLPDTEAGSYEPAFTLETDGGLTPSGPTIWDIEIPEDALIRFTSANDASPGTFVSLLAARAVDSVFPARKKNIISVYVINARPMLHAEKTAHNCIGMAVLPYTSRISQMPLERQCTAYRGMTILQSDENAVLQNLTAGAVQIRKTAESAATLEEKEKIFGQMFSAGEGYVTFLVSYVGKWNMPGPEHYMRALLTHVPNTYSLGIQISAVSGKIFLSIIQRFRENTVREAFLSELKKHGIPFRVCRVMENDIARFGP